MTFSINTGQPTESTSYQLTGDVATFSTFSSLLERLEDNNTGLINPPDIRDSILSTWSSTIFKVTRPTGSNIPYIGIDTLNPNNNLLRDLKNRKIVFGKRYYESTHIMSDGLLSRIDTATQSDCDILFYNTKSDNQQQITTRLGILAGINPSNLNAPFIQSQVISGTTSVSFDFISNGDIIVNSDITKINEFRLPNSASASNDKVISWNVVEDSMTFDDLTIQIPSEIGATGSPLDIFGDPINLNGYDINFSDNRICPIEIGDIKIGETFTNSSISDMLKRMIYQYLPPSSSIRLLPPHSSGYVEVGIVPNVSIEFSIFKKTLPTLQTSLLNMTPGSYPPINTVNYSTVISTASGIVTSPINTTGVTFSINVSDGTQSSTSSTNIRGVYPYYHGFSGGVINNASLLQLTKKVEDKTDKNIIIQPGSGFFYFIYDSNHGSLTEILDENDIDIIGSVDMFTSTLSSPNGFWVNKVFNVYRINNLTVNIPLVYKFKY